MPASNGSSAPPILGGSLTLSLSPETTSIYTPTADLTISSLKSPTIPSLTCNSDPNPILNPTSIPSPNPSQLPPYLPPYLHPAQSPPSCNTRANPNSIPPSQIIRTGTPAPSPLHLRPSSEAETHHTVVLDHSFTHASLAPHPPIAISLPLFPSHALNPTAPQPRTSPRPSFPTLPACVSLRGVPRAPEPHSRLPAVRRGEHPLRPHQHRPAVQLAGPLQQLSLPRLRVQLAVGAVHDAAAAALRIAVRLAVRPAVLPGPRFKVPAAPGTPGGGRVVAGNILCKNGLWGQM